MCTLNVHRVSCQEGASVVAAKHTPAISLVVQIPAGLIRGLRRSSAGLERGFHGDGLVPVRVRASILRLSVQVAVGAVWRVTAVVLGVDLRERIPVGGRGDGRAGVARVVGRAQHIVVVCSERTGVRTSGDDAELGIRDGVWVCGRILASVHLPCGRVLASVHLPRSRVLASVHLPVRAGAGSVVVGWTRAVALLFLVVEEEQDLHYGRAEEEDSGDDGEGEDGGVEPAGA